MLKVEFTDEAATNCWEAARRVLQHFGRRDQQGRTAYSAGSLEVAENNGGDTEVSTNGQLVLRVPLVQTPNRPVLWNPGDWIEELDRLDQATSR